MNQWSQQSNMFQGQQGGFQQQNIGQQQYEPIGYVKSNYQGQLSYPSFGQQSNSIVHQPGGYQQAHTNQYGAQAQSNFAGSQYQAASHQPVQSYASSPATAFGNVGPVIARYGYQAGQDSQQAQQHSAFSNQGAHYAQHSPAQFGSNYSNMNNFGSQGAHNYGGMTQAHSNTSMNPVYQATNAYEQSGPVISRLGWSTNDSQAGFNSGGMR